MPIERSTEMQNKSSVQILRYVFIIAVLILVCSVFCARLVSIQIIDPPDDSGRYDIPTYTRKEIISAQRGEIYDRNGKPLVTNDYSRSIVLDYGDFPWTADEVNTLILNSVQKIAECDGEESLTKIEYFPIEYVSGDIRYKESYLDGGEDDFRLQKMLAHYELSEDTSASDFIKYMIERWKLTDENGAYKYGADETGILICRRYDMDYKQFGPSTQYTLTEKASIKAISAVLESNLRGVTTKIESERVYEYPGYMSHILGRCGKIPGEKLAEYILAGYSMDATVGLGGVEQAFEEYLRGIDGEITIVEDMDGNILEKYVSREPVAGKDVYLTIDVELQIVAEDSLAYRIKKVAADGLLAGGEMSGADADAGAIVAIDPKTNGILCMASYPTYDLSRFDELFSDLIADEKAPMLNRALNAEYAPGSTFKLATSVAALSEGVITGSTKIKDTGVYKYYDDYQPHCWIYDMYGTSHGSINVVEAIQHSCNYFYFETGRLLGIDKLDKYASAFGLGRNTGIELSEKTGVLASPEYAQTSGVGGWMPGDTLAASIGQSYHLFTPTQLACYLSSLLNYGTRYSAHLLYGVYDFSTNEPVYTYENKVMDGCIDLDPTHITYIKRGMRAVMSANLTKAAFADLTAVEAAGKTGTAQIGGKNSDNATFVSFAPYTGTPEIVVAGIIENGVTGNNTAYVISDIMEKFFQGEAHIG